MPIAGYLPDTLSLFVLLAGHDDLELSKFAYFQVTVKIYNFEF